PWAGRDESLWFPALGTLRWLVVPQSRVFEAIFLRARAAAVGHRSAVRLLDNDERSRSANVFRWVKSKAQLLYTTLKALDWMIQVRKLARSELRHDKFDVIFTSYPSLASPLSGWM